MTEEKKAQARKKLQQVRALLNELEDDLGEEYTEEQMDELEGDEPISNVVAAINCVEDAICGLVHM